MIKYLKFALAVLVVFSLSACMAHVGESEDTGDAGSTGGSSGEKPKTCVPNDQKDCVTSDGKEGTQTCSSDGSKYGTCKANPEQDGTGGSGNSQACTPGIENGCVTSDGKEGVQTCAEDGSKFGPCKAASKPACVPGETRSCTTTSGDCGVQECKSDGSGYTKCTAIPSDDGTGGTDVTPPPSDDSPETCEVTLFQERPLNVTVNQVIFRGGTEYIENVLCDSNFNGMSEMTKTTSMCTVEWPNDAWMILSVETHYADDLVIEDEGVKKSIAKILPSQTSTQWTPDEAKGEDARKMCPDAYVESSQRCSVPSEAYRSWSKDYVNGELLTLEENAISNGSAGNNGGANWKVWIHCD